MGKAAAEYYLMHKDIRVALMEITEDGSVSRVRRNEDAKEHFPPGGQMNPMKFHDWWKDRAIPETRHGAKTALQKLGYASTNNAMVDNLALSLCDCYWIMPRGENLTWNEVNLFSNDFVDAFGEITINREHTVDFRRATRFNCAASQGELQKKWCIDEDGRRYMIKGNYGQSYQQSLNEVFAAKLHEKQNFPKYTSYYLSKLKVEGDMEGLGCLSYNYCNDRVESLSAWELIQTIKIRQNESWYYPLKQVCLNMGMAENDFNEFMDYQIMTDYLITNTDRHMNNISILRDPDSLELLGFAPIYDSGNSMFYNVPYENLGSLRISEIRTHSFVERENRLLQYVQNRNAVDLEKAEMDFTIYLKDVTERHIRIPRIKELYEEKIELLRAFQQGTDIWKSAKYR